MRMPHIGPGLTAWMLLFASATFIAANERVTPAENPPASTQQQQVAPPPVVFPQDVPKIEIPTATSTPLVPADQEFLTKAFAIISAERELGKLASERGETAEVKALGRELLTSQVKNAAALQELAKLKNFDLKMPLENPQEEILAPVQDKSGAEFDTAFRESIAQDRSKSIQLFLAGAKSAKDPAVRGLAMQALNELKKERPLATVEAVKSAQNSREISKTALKPQSAATAQPAPELVAPQATNGTIPPAAVVPPSTVPAPAPASAVTVGPTRVPPAVAVAPVPQAPARTPQAAASLETPIATHGVNPASVDPRFASPTIVPQTNVRPSSSTSTFVPPASQPQVTNQARASVSTAPNTSPSSHRIIVAPQNGVPQPSSVSPVLESPVASTSGTTPRTSPSRVVIPPRTVTSEETRYLEEPPRSVPKRNATVTIQEAPRPRVVRRVNEVTVEERAPSTPPPRKVIRRKIIVSDDEDDNDED